METNIKKTVGGFIIEDFKIIEQPEKNGVLEPHVYEGIIVGHNSNPDEKQYITWDKYGRCNNWKRSDCFINTGLKPISVSVRTIF